MQGSLLGPAFTEAEIEQTLRQHGAVYERLDPGALHTQVARLLASDKVIGWVQGRMEFGPRALGNRSILGDPRSPRLQSVMNLKVKFRESFRPFAPAVLHDRARDYFQLSAESPYMLIVAEVNPSLRQQPGPANSPGNSPAPGHAARPDLVARVNQVRSTLPAVTHVDYSARVQTVGPDDNPDFHRLLTAFAAETGCAVLINTSFNVRGEPVVCTPDDAYRCFMNTEMDYLVIGPFLLDRTRQPQRTVTRTFEPIPD
jgi:carbamoyltransferase